MAWIPCVSGTLDFSRFSVDLVQRSQKDDIDFPVSASYVDEHDISRVVPRVRHCITSTVYDWKDLPESQSDKKTSGKYRIITLSETNEQGDLEGDAFIVLHDYVLQDEQFSGDILNPLRALEDDISKYRQAITENLYSPSFVLQTSDVAKQKKKIRKSILSCANTRLRNHIYHVKYLIKPSGITLLKYQDRLDIDNLNYVQDADLFEKRLHHKFVAEKTTFIFLKSILHIHKHHNENEDNITSVHAINHDNPRLTAFRLIEDMQKTAIEIKNKEIQKAGVTEHYFDGFVSYCHSLILSLLRMEVLDSKDAKHFIAFFNNMLNSWRSISERNQAEKDALKEGNTEFLQLTSLFVASVALMIFTFIRYASAMTAGASDQNVESRQAHWILEFFEQPSGILDIVFWIFVSVLGMICFRLASNPNSPVRRLANSVIQSKHFGLAGLRKLLIFIIATGSTLIFYLSYLALNA
ncbi:hypothetical protein ACFO4O_11840 [Glaciecola siphonariae]|uniref:Uncharacterized protein n=1 Tax=Glaciecola siphonariae TaxID=521012 RepID=A0ABV9LXI1_9ALTE